MPPESWRRGFFPRESPALSPQHGSLLSPPHLAAGPVHPANRTRSSEQSPDIRGRSAQAWVRLERSSTCHREAHRRRKEPPQARLGVWGLNAQGHLPIFTESGLHVLRLRQRNVLSNLGEGCMCSDTETAATTGVGPTSHSSIISQRESRDSYHSVTLS